MNNYIKQLLELIDEKRNKACLKNKLVNEDEDNHQEFATEFLQGTPEKISTIVGIDKYHFPTSDKLNDTQIKKLYEGIEALLYSYNLEFMFPENVSEQIKYQFIIDQWNSEHVKCKQAIVQIETCKFDENDCPFPGHCNVCESFKCDNDKSHYLEKGLLDFNNLTPDFSPEEEEQIRTDVDKVKALMLQPQNENYIPGIHNYCDGRCEHCDFTSKCSSYSLNQELDKFSQKPDKEDDSNKQLIVMLQATSEIIEEELEKQGLELNDAIENMIEDDKPQGIKHSLEKQAESYAEKVKRWLESNQLELESRLVSHPNSEVKKYFETVSWFQLFIPAKVNRAINGLHKDNATDIDSFDAKGSAKIALIAIDECIHAWGGLLEYISKKEDSILNILRHLSRLKTEIEEFFPSVRDFIRPGLDE